MASLGVVTTVALREFRFGLKRPLFWIFLVLTELLYALYFTGAVGINIGSGGLAATEKPHLNGAMALAQFHLAIPFVVTTLFAAIAFASPVARDFELRMEEILLSTRLTPRRYLVGKWLGTAAWTGAVIGAGLVTAIVADVVAVGHAASDVNSDPDRYGPTNVLFHLLPFVLYALPWLFFVCSLAFFLGVRTKSMLVVCVSLVLLWSVALLFGDFDPDFVRRWSQDVLHREWKEVRSWFEPSGFDWLKRTWLDEDRGVRVYNTTFPAADLPFTLNRLGLVFVGLFALWRTFARFGVQRHGKAAAALADHPAAAGGPDHALVPVAALVLLRRNPRRTIGSFRRVVAGELRLLARQVSVWVFGLVVLMMSIPAAIYGGAPYGATPLHTSWPTAHTLAAVLAFWSASFAAFLVVESLHRERATGFFDVLRATPISTVSLVTGKLVAVLFVLVLLVATAAGCVMWLQVVSDGTRADPEVYARVLGTLLLPGLLFFGALGAFFAAICASRLTVYAWVGALGLGYGFAAMIGVVDWRWSIVPTSLTVASDLAGMRPYAAELMVNRVVVGAVTLLLVGCAVAFFPRNDRFRPDLLSTRSLRRHSLLTVVALLLVGTAVAGVAWLWIRIDEGPERESLEDWQKEYARRNREKWGPRAAELPEYEKADFDVTFLPAERRFRIDGRFTFLQRADATLKALPLTFGPDHEVTLESFAVVPISATNGSAEPELPAAAEDRKGLWEIALPRPLRRGERVTVRLKFSGYVHRGSGKRSASFGQWILDDAIFVHSFGTQFLPQVGFVDPEAGEKGYDATLTPAELEALYAGEDPAFGGMRGPFDIDIRVNVPRDLEPFCVGREVERHDVDDPELGARRVARFTSDHPIYFVGVMAGRLVAADVNGAKVWHHPDHARNALEMATAMDQARRFYSKVFSPYPFQELRIVEFPRFAGFAMGFPTLIPFSEGIGFLTKADDGISNLLFMVTAHEVAHQWWGTVTWPADVPGFSLLTEGLAHYSTLLMEERFQGPVAARNRRIQFERDYLGLGSEGGRRADVERPLVFNDDSQAGDQTVRYNKAGLVFFMTGEALGRERFVAALRDYIREFTFQPDHPTVHDLLRSIRRHGGPEQEPFLRQWFYEVVLPHLEVVSARCEPRGARFLATVRVRNVGSGTMPVVVEVASRRRLLAEQGATPDPVRFAADDLPDPPGRATQPTGETAPPVEPYRAVRGTITLGPGEERELTLECEFQPRHLLLDPDAHLLMRGRSRAQAAF